MKLQVPANRFAALFVIYDAVFLYIYIYILYIHITSYHFRGCCRYCTFTQVHTCCLQNVQDNKYLQHVCTRMSACKMRVLRRASSSSTRGMEAGHPPSWLSYRFQCLCSYADHFWHLTLGVMPIFGRIFQDVIFATHQTLTHGYLHPTS